MNDGLDSLHEVGKVGVGVGGEAGKWSSIDRHGRFWLKLKMFENNCCRSVSVFTRIKFPTKRRSSSELSLEATNATAEPVVLSLGIGTVSQVYAGYRTVVYTNVVQKVDKSAWHARKEIRLRVLPHRSCTEVSLKPRCILFTIKQ